MATTADIIAFVKRDLGIGEKLRTKATIERAEEELGLQGAKEGQEGK